jgi:hypothetical protein
MPNNSFDRRAFLKIGAAGLAVAGLPALAACAQDPTTLPLLALSPQPANAGNRVLSHSVHIPVKSGRAAELGALLAKGGLFANRTPGVHFARAAQLSAAHLGQPEGNPGELTLGIIYDRRIETALNFLAQNADALDAALAFCEGYAAGTASDPAALRAYLEPHLVPDNLFFTAYDKAENEVLACLAVQDNFLALLQRADFADPRELPYLVDRFLLADAPHARMLDQPRPTHRSGSRPFRPHTTNTLTMVQPLMRGRLDPQRIVPCSASRLERVERFVGKHFDYREAFEFILREGEFAVKDLREHPLAALHTLHFARIAVIETGAGHSMLFSSVYDGDFTQYVLDFGSRVADQIDFIWGLTENYPRAGCRDVPGFIAWIRDGQVDVQDFYSAHGNITLLRIQQASRLREKLAVLSRDLAVDPTALRAQLKTFVRENQALLS